MIRTLAITMYFLCLCALSGEPDYALTRLENYKPTEGSLVLKDILHSVNQTMPTGDYQSWQRLRTIIGDESLVPQVRMGALDIVLQKADQRIASEVLVDGCRWSELVALGQGSNSTLVLLVDRLLEHLATSPWREWSGSSVAGMTLIQNGAIGKGLGLESHGKAMLALSNSTAAIADRQQIALRIIAATMGHTETSPVLIALLDESCFPALREMVHRSADPLTFQYHATAYLAYLGDEGVLPTLRERERSFRLFTNRTPGYEDIGPRMANLIGMWIEEIEMQHPPTALLDFIASNRRLEINESHWREWAVRRAVEIGLDKRGIREAILKFASRVQPTVVRHKKTGDSRVFYYQLVPVKRVGLSLNILSPEDLPQVHVPVDANLEQH
ncbi:MAG: hypothetical protein KF745_07985 [Phycisphaeraceae bacterium]|nr:hypothetical protein [Phycisphaeraceae bacterium]